MGYEDNLFKLYSFYASKTGKTLKSIKLKYNDRYIFLSKAKKMTIKDLVGVREMPMKYAVDARSNEVFTFTTRPNQITSRANNNTDISIAATSTASHRISKTSRNRPSQQRSQWAGHVELPSDKEIHSLKMSPVFEEMEQKLQFIREEINKSSIKRTEPKDKSEKSKRVPLQQISNNNNVDSVGPDDKAGRSIYIINVGAAENLYATSKKHNKIRSQPMITIDLHGHSKQQALAALETSLPCWVETAMKQEHPYVIQVKIVCGKGSQILSEVVEGWIKDKDKVANAPRSQQ